MKGCTTGAFASIEMVPAPAGGHERFFKSKGRDCGTNVLRMVGYFALSLCSACLIESVRHPQAATSVSTRARATMPAPTCCAWSATLRSRACCACTPWSATTTARCARWPSCTPSSAPTCSRPRSPVSPVAGHLQSAGLTKSLRAANCGTHLQCCNLGWTCDCPGGALSSSSW